jgi:hypothetical protein
MHRLIMEAGRGMVIDHVNGHTLDNRSKNLRPTTVYGNNANVIPLRRHLLRGVEQWGNLYGGCIKCNGVRYRSKKKWDDPKLAHRWYLRMFKQLYKHRCPSDEDRKKEYVRFPARIDGCPF